DLSLRYRYLIKQIEKCHLAFQLVLVQEGSMFVEQLNSLSAQFFIRLSNEPIQLATQTSIALDQRLHPLQRLPVLIRTSTRTLLESPQVILVQGNLFVHGTHGGAHVLAILVEIRHAIPQQNALKPLQTILNIVPILL